MYRRWTLSRWIILAIASAIVIFAGSISHIRRRAVEINRADRQAKLQNSYRLVNSGWFADSLPEDTVVLFTPTNDMLVGYTDCSSSPCQIVINSIYNQASSVAEETLRHEMCHVSTWGELDEHGKEWKQCMLNLAEHGAFDNVW